MKTVQEGLKNLYNKILTLHEKIDPNISRQFYTERFNSFKQHELIIEGITFMFDSLSDKVQQLLAKCPTTQYIDRIERLLQKQEQHAKRLGKPLSRDLQNQQPFKTASQSTRLKSEDVEKRRNLLEIRKSSEGKDRQLTEKDLNLAVKRPSHPMKHRTAYATRFDMERMTPRTKPGSRQPLYPTANQNLNTQADLPENSPFQDSSIYHHIKTENEKMNQKTLSLKQKSRRNSKMLSINVMKNSLKVW